MRKYAFKVWDLPSSGTSAALIVLAVAFVIGNLAGCILTNQVIGSGSESLNRYLTGYLSLYQTGETVAPDLLTLVWDIVRWPLLLVVLGLTPVGLVGIPIVFLVRGFLLSFSVSAFRCVLGNAGLGLALLVFGMTGLIYMPVFCVLGVQSFLLSGDIAERLLGEKRQKTLITRSLFLRFGMSIAALCVCGIAEYCLVPEMISFFFGAAE